MFIAKNNDLIILAKETRSELEKALEFMVFTEIVETEEKYVLVNGKYVVEENAVEIYKKEFEKQFISTSLGNFRLNPKGYANAQQSIDTINNMVMVLGELNDDLAKMIIFYKTPDFAKEEQRTEEWLIANQYNPKPMTKEEWLAFYVEFSKSYASKVYIKAEK
mgnify:CR=1 FL=1